MELDEIREQLAKIISTDQSIWDNVLDNTTPGHYGCDNWEAEIDYNDIFVNIPNRTFTINTGSFSAELVMGSSKGDSSFNESYNKTFSATGEFDFKNSKEINITEINIDIDSDIYS